jgi:hypothetical protein
MARQKRLAGTKPTYAVRNAITQMTALLAEATIHPCHMRRPTSTVDKIVNPQDT